MKKLLKIAGIVAVVLVLIVGVGVWWVLSNLDSIAKDHIEKSGTQVLGVPTHVDSVGIHILRGNVGISGLDIANPSGFTGKHFLALKHGEVNVSLGTLRQDTIDVPTFTLTGIDLSIEQGSSGANYQKILDNVQKGKGSAPAPASTGPEKKLIIDHLLIENIMIHADLKGVSGVGQLLSSNTSVDLPIERIELRNVGRTGTGVTPGELSSIVVQAVMAAAVEKGEGKIPEIILGDIQHRLGSIGDLGKMPIEIVGKAGESAVKLGEKAVEGVGKAAGDAAKQIGDGIGDLIGGKKDDKKKP